MAARTATPSATPRPTPAAGRSGSRPSACAWAARSPSSTATLTTKATLSSRPFRSSRTNGAASRSTWSTSPSWAASTTSAPWDFGSRFGLDQVKHTGSKNQQDDNEHGAEVVGEEPVRARGDAGLVDHALREAHHERDRRIRAE